MTDTTKLLPCPFCGGKAELNTWGNDRDGCHVAKVICDSCSASADSFETQDQAVAAWNWRSARKWDVSFMRALSESTHNALVQKALAEVSEASESLSAENARLREALGDIVEAHDRGDRIAIARQALGDTPDAPTP